MASDLTAPQLLDLRRNYLRDEWNANAAFPGGLSNANTALMKSYFTDDQLKSIDEDVQRRWATDLIDLETWTVSYRLGLGEAQELADTTGAAERRSARYHLITALALSRMADDPKFTATQTVKGADVESNRMAMKRQAMEHFAYAGITIELVR